MVNMSNAWITIEPQPPKDSQSFPDFVLELGSPSNRFSSIADGDWILVVTAGGEFTRVGRVLRSRVDAVSTTFYFESVLTASERIATTGLPVPQTDSIVRLQWSVFVENLKKLTDKTLMIYVQLMIRRISGSCSNSR